MWEWFEGKNAVLIAMAAMIVALSLVPANAQAATYYSIKPGKEVCTSIVFGEDGRGEYTLTTDDTAPGSGWIDNHFTSFIAGPENIILVPICFSAVGRSINDQTNVMVVVSTPSGNVTYEYGVCVSSYEDVDETDGPVSGNACTRMAEHTDIFSADLTQPEKYAKPGDAVTFTLVLDSSLPLTLDVTKETEAMQITASKTSIEAGAGQESVQLQVTAPSSPGDYDFIVKVSVKDCGIQDCHKDVRGVLHVSSTEDQPQAGFYVWLTPETKSIMGQQSTMYVISFQNYGDGQELTASVSTEEGLDSDFSPYSTFVAKGGSKSVTFTVRPSTADLETYKITGLVTGRDGAKREAVGWLTVDEMVADASKLGQDEFVEEYGEEGGASLEDWEELRSVTGAPIADGDTTLPITPPTDEPNLILWAVIGIVVALVVVLVIFIYKKTVVHGEATWESLGV